WGVGNGGSVSNWVNWLKTNHQQPTTNHKQPTTNNQQPTTNDKQPTTNNQQPTTLENPIREYP
ncbi:MAG TPA: hypothetical protein DCY91_11535, partial [Cyanobacteria bacterium UBA11370]|nr:hypothetical protein [Cyanobacteria bacterium UBA11370]